MNGVAASDRSTDKIMREGRSHPHPDETIFVRKSIDETHDWNEKMNE